MILHKRNDVILLVPEERFKVMYPEHRRVTGYINTVLGNIQTSESTGKKDKSRFWVNTGTIITIDARKEEVDKRYRRLRPEEASSLEAIDREIRGLRAKRETLLKQAWQKAHTITLKELTEKAEA